MKLIFLDIDGVLCIPTIHRDKYGQLWEQQYVDNLNNIILQTGANIVVSSTWRKFRTIEWLQGLFKTRGVIGNAIGKTPILQDKIRGEEIKQWLDNFESNVQSYCIIDDDRDMLDEQLPYFVKTSRLKCEDAIYNLGLTKKCMNKAINILNNNNLKQ